MWDCKGNVSTHQHSDGNKKKGNMPYCCFDGCKTVIECVRNSVY